MPMFEVTTKRAEKVWSSPDGQRVIYKVLLDYNGQTMQAQTFSGAIATEGWHGTVESYEKVGKRGTDTFVKQPPKDSTAPQQGAAKPMVGDQFTMFLAYAKDIAVALIDAKEYTTERLNEIVNDVALAGEMLYEARPGAKKPEQVKAELDKVFDDVEPMDGGEDPWNPNNVPTIRA